MKKRNNKIIVLVLIAIIFLVSLLIFILNYSKDDSSFSILEKKWINDNASNVIDISVYNDIPVYLDVNNFFGGHFAIFGNSGSGKSCGISRLFQNMFYDKRLFPYK